MKTCLYILIGLYTTYSSGKSFTINQSPRPVSSDTTIYNARLMDSVTEEIIWRHPDHWAMSLRFETKNENQAPVPINVLMYAPEVNGKHYLTINKLYTIHGNFKLNRVAVTQPFFRADSVLTILCDSIKLQH